jgi:predicted RNA-binding Zn ribbon-like protein
VEKVTLETVKTIDPTGFFFIAGNLSLDFINTQIVENNAPKDLLTDFSEFANWAATANLLEKSEAEKLVTDWSGTNELKDIFEQVLNFRQILREMFTDISQGKTADKTAISAINEEIKNQSGTIEIRKTDTGFEKIFRAAFQEPRQLLAPIAESAADLLCYGNPIYIKKCESSECVLYFYDTTKNHSRRWCSMAGCGNRAKAAAFYKRKNS